MNRTIPRNALKIKAIDKRGKTFFCTRNFERGNYSAVDEEGKRWYVFTDHLRNTEYFPYVEVTERTV